MADHYERPTWGQLLDMVERFCDEEETVGELRWLRDHPVDWLMTARFMRARAQAHTAQQRLALSKLTVANPVTGRPTREYLAAKAEVDRLNGRRIAWMAKLNEQIAEAKHLLGWEKVPNDLRADLVDRLVRLRTALVSELYESQDVRSMVEALIRTYGDDRFDATPYRP